MNTAGLVAEIALLNPDWSSARILGLLNNLLQMAFKKPLKSQLYIVPTTGDFPFLTTTAGTYKYSVSVSSVWSVSEIITDTDVSGWVATGPINFGTNTTPDKFSRKFTYNDRNYWTVPCSKVNAIGSTVPTVQFGFDPGSYSDRYRIAGYDAPTTVLSTTTEYPVDDNFRYSVIIPAVQLLIDGFDNGRYAENMLYIEDKLLPKLAYSAEAPFDGIFCANSSY